MRCAPCIILNSLATFVNQLALSPLSSRVFNFYAGDSAAAAMCRDNLEQYLTLMTQHRPAWLLVGEAPGYRGCRQTGVPFTSEQILLSHPRFGSAHGFGGLPAVPTPQREATATIVWRTLDDLALIPLLWNVFPFHPHRDGESLSNRTPTATEIQAGEPYLRELLAAFPVKIVVTVGKKASYALGRWGIEAAAIRHPAHGGAVQFRRELKALAGRTD